MDKELNKVTTITNSLAEKKELQGFLESVGDKPLFEEKVEELNELIKDLKFSQKTV